MRRAPIVVQFYLVVVVAVAGTFFCGAAGAGLTAGVAGFGLFATTGAVWALAGVLIGVFIVVGMAVFIAALLTADAGVLCKGAAVDGLPLTTRCCWVAAPIPVPTPMPA